MQTKRTRPRQAQTYLQSEGNLALADECLDFVQQRTADPPARKLRLVQNTAAEDAESDALGQAKDITTEIRIGLAIILCALWFVIVFSSFRIVKLLIS